MSQLKITRVSDSHELCWGLFLLDDNGNELLRSLEAANKQDAASMAETLKLEGADAPVSEDGKEDTGRPTWIILKTGQGWAVRFSPLTIVTFDLFLKLEAAARAAEGSCGGHRKGQGVLGRCRYCLGTAGGQTGVGTGHDQDRQRAL